MKQPVISLRRQLLTWLLIPILSLCLILSIVIYLIAVNFATDSYDNMLEDTARVIASRLYVDQNRVLIDLPSAAQAILREDSYDQFYYQVRDSKGVVISGDTIIPPPVPSDVKEGADFIYGQLNGQPVRIGFLNFLVPGKPSSLPVLIRVAETLIGRQQLTREILVAVLLPQLVLIVLAALLVWVGVTRGLAPLKKVQESISRRTQWDLRPINEAEAPREIQPLLSAINQLLGRLNEDIQAQRRFVSNAAHQLRTPIAGLKTQTELALRTNQPENLMHILQLIHTSAERAARLINQMLSLAKLEGTQVTQRSLSLLDLNEVAREAMQQAIPFALNKQIDLGFEESLTRAKIKGDLASLQELVLNLVDNAIRYTPSGGKVTVKVSVDHSMHLVVEDNGPGIPYEEREHVFERFYSVLGTKVDGSGLGLAIVKEIVEVHGARVSLSSGHQGKGTLVDVEFLPAVFQL